MDPEDTSCIRSSVSLLFLPNQPAYYILIKSSLRRNCVLVGIHPRSGALKFSFTNGKDIFATETDALEHLRKYGPVEVVGAGMHVLGYVVIGSTALLLIAEKVRVAAMLPGHHAVKSVAVSKWHRITLQQEPDANGNASAVSREEQARGVEKIITFPIDGAHFFCETLDITRPFPSDRPVLQPCWEFVWNRWLNTSWVSIGLDHVCPPLLQGLCEVRTIHDFDAAPFQLVLISRKARLHVGPRYMARGLNELADPGNEIECEQIIWRLQPGADMRKAPIQWSRYVWRRGSVPLWWSVKIKNQGMGEAEIKIQQSCTFKGSRRYVRRLQKRFAPNPHLDPDDELLQSDGQDPSLQFPIVFVSLLRKGTLDKDRSETKLASAFDAMAGALRKEHRLPLTYIALDWHEMDKVLGHEGIVEAFWQQIRDLLPKHGFALGTMTQVGPDHTDPRILLEDDGFSRHSQVASMQRCLGTAGAGWEVRWFRQQRGLMRYNCADSLDRTNVSSFFGAVQVFVEQCRELDIAIALAPRGVNGMAAMLRKPPPSPISVPGPSLFGMASSRPGTRPSTPVNNPAAAAGSKAGITAIEKLGKELNKGLLTLMQDIKSLEVKTPKVQAVAASMTAPRPDVNLTRRSMPHQAAHQPPVQGHANPNLLQQLELLDAAGPLPQGWEAKVDRSNNRVFYVDHNSKTTSWVRPQAQVVSPRVETPPGQTMGIQNMPRAPPATPMTAGPNDSKMMLLSSALSRHCLGADRDKWEPLIPWGMLKAEPRGLAKKFARRILPDALSSMAELFLVNGDLSAWLYTGSQAMHSERILIFEPADSKLRKAGIGQYGGMLVGLKRRFNNVWVDADKQMQMDMFLGLKHKEYFGNTFLYYREDSTMPLDFPETDDEQDPVAKMDWPVRDKQTDSSTASKAGPFAGHARRYSSQDLFNQVNMLAHTQTAIGLVGTGSILGSQANGAVCSKSSPMLAGQEERNGLGLSQASSMPRGPAEATFLSYGSDRDDCPSDASSTMSSIHNSRSFSALVSALASQGEQGTSSIIARPVNTAPSSPGFSPMQSAFPPAAAATGAAATVRPSGRDNNPFAERSGNGEKDVGLTAVAGVFKTGIKKLTDPLAGLL